MDKWIDIKEHLPAIGQRVLVFAVGKKEAGFEGETATAITSMGNTNLFNCNLETKPYWHQPWQYFLTDYEITHWMPLPGPPEKTCATCKHYIGGLDWNLCCDLKYDLCYRHTPACDKYVQRLEGNGDKENIW